MDLATTASLIVAAFELSSVRLVRDAMRTADLSAGRGQSATPLGPAPNPAVAPGRVIRPEPRYEPRPVIHPAPRLDTRAVRAAVRHEPVTACGPCCDAGVGPLTTRPVPAVERPIPPVWATLPPVAPEHPASRRRLVKVTRYQPDTRHKGIVVDVHV